MVVFGADGRAMGDGRKIMRPWVPVIKEKVKYRVVSML